MQNFVMLALILLPMFVGYLIPHSQALTQRAERGLNYLVFVILVVIGIELGQVADLSQKLSGIILYVGSLLILTLMFGSVGLWVFEKMTVYPYPKIKHAKNTHQTHGASALIQPLCIVMGFGLTKLLPTLHLPKYTITGLLMVLLFLVGICLRGSGVGLRQALFNRYGLYLSLVFMGATLAGGAVFALIFKLPIFQGLALASGFGWYSLSGTVMTEAYGVIWGSVALFNDLGRELLALMLIPYVMRYCPPVAIGLGGVTSLDFTLPTLTQAGGIEIAPLVVSFGFITNVVSPILMVVFSAI